MCGIAGFLALEQGVLATRTVAQAMCDVIEHRGPDDEGFLVDGPLAMGMRRLSIIDLAGGHQPITNEDGNISVIQNGEIYNFQELRRELESLGHRFKTNCDTEAIVHLYEEYGTACVKKLRGMFAFAIWDAPRRRLMLARDRLGIKPLYYSHGRGRLLFGSELKSLLAAGLDREIDLQALHDYLSLTYVPAPATIFRAARKLPAGTFLVAENGAVKIERYWELRLDPESPAKREEEYVEAVLEKLDDAVRSHLVSDVPLGVFLSGGIDSASVVACMRRFHTGPLKTFSIGFAEKSFSELDRARTIARHFETDHHEMVVTPDAAALVPELVQSFDEPFADSSAIPVLCVSRLAREQVTVALSGEGGDEVFAGYQTYRATKLAGLYRRTLPAAARRMLPRLVEALPVSHRKVSFDYKAKRFTAGASLPDIEAHLSWKAIFTEDAKRALYQGPAQGVRPTVRLYREMAATVPSRDLLAQLLAIDTHLGLESDMLVKVDRMTMATSLEARVPFLDHPLVELAARSPSALKLHGLTTKYLLKRAMRDRLPRQTTRGPKQGFNVPIPVWLLGPLKELVHDTLSPQRIAATGLFRPEMVEGLIRAHENHERDLSRDIWTLLMFQVWHDNYATQSTPRRQSLRKVAG
ncbi:MAG TPA: asparagine synthase (glutamine-hydrolyzing) [Candidatus Bathyarchaeia archaeon]|nr:asparagine synthase (glutamine-hydrolyzing) [Candidatus Bathyarchaeia archaeon]